MTESKKPEIGTCYDRDEIFEMFGGSKQSALPFKNGDAVAGCYTLDMNPNAPKEILVGIGRDKEKYSKRAAERNTQLPIFIKRAVNKFEFVGNYRAVKYSTDPAEIKQKNKTKRNDVAGVLYFEEVKTK